MMDDLFYGLLADERAKLRDARLPRWNEPMLATLTDEPFSDDAWLYERKLDGERCLAFLGDGGVRLRSRNRNALESTYPELVDELADRGPAAAVVDGEIVAFDGGVTSFARLQRRMQIDDPAEARRSRVAVYLYLFDVLHLAGRDTRELPLAARKQLLKRSFRYGGHLRWTPHRRGDGKARFAEACGKGWEGLIAKRGGSVYAGGRSRDWLKFKCTARQEFVVGGFTEPAGERRGFGALLLGYHDNGDLRYAGRVGTGFDDELLDELGSRLERLERRSSPFTGDVAGSGIHWVAPRLVCEVGFTAWTRAGRLRHPRFLGLRTDKDPDRVVRERPAG